MELGNFYKNNKPELSKIFLDWREKFLIYGSYCANLTEAQATLQEICDRDELANQEVIVCIIFVCISSKSKYIILPYRNASLKRTTASLNYAMYSPYRCNVS